jgi:hypothetical protein
MNDCLTKHFGIPAMARNEAANVLTNLMCATLGEIERMNEAGEFPACIKLLVGVLLDDVV